MNQKQTIDSPTIDYMRKMHRWRMAFFGLVILLAGIVIGAASILTLAPHRLMRPPQSPDIAAEGLLSDLRRELNLSPEQEREIEPIIQEHMRTLDEMRTNARSEITEHLRKMNEEISAILSEQQRQIWQRRLHYLQRQLRPPGRGPGEPGRRRGGPPQRMRRGSGSFGPGRRSTEPNHPWNRTDLWPPQDLQGTFGEEPRWPENFRRSPGKFGPRRPVAGPNTPLNGMNPDIMPAKNEKSINEDL